MTGLDYWKECISTGAEECDLELTGEQLECLAETAQGGHENYGMAFYSPPASDRLNDIEDEWRKKYNDLQADFDRYRDNAEKAVGRALHQYDDANISIGDHGEVYRIDGRHTQIQ